MPDSSRAAWTRVSRAFRPVRRKAADPKSGGLRYSCCRQTGPRVIHLPLLTFRLFDFLDSLLLRTVDDSAKRSTIRKALIVATAAFAFCLLPTAGCTPPTHFPSCRTTWWHRCAGSCQKRIPPLPGLAPESSARARYQTAIVQSRTQMSDR